MRIRIPETLLNLDFNPFPILATDRLLLRNVLPSDAPEMFLLRSDLRVISFIDRPPAKTLDEAVIFIDKINKMEDNNECITWAITKRENPKMMGLICFLNFKKEHFRAEIGYALNFEFHRKGIMQEAITEVIKFGFNTINLHSIEANINPGNTASMKLLERNNFVREAYFRENYFFDGKFLDSAIYSLVKRIESKTI